MNNKPNTPTLIFSDLDGTILDHHSYDYSAVQPLLNILEEKKIPVIFNTSKTFAELIPLRESLNNRHPFIIENGAAIYIPDDYFPEDILHNKEILKTFASVTHITQVKGYNRISFSQSREYWQHLLEPYLSAYGNQFIAFSQMSDNEIAKHTGLTEKEANLANQREFSEPLLWRSDEKSKRIFTELLEHAGVKMLQGGRFLHVCGHCDKGYALEWLRKFFARQWGISCSDITSIALGDSQNDAAMLDTAETAIIIPSPTSAPPILNRQDAIIGDTPAPQGWCNEVKKFLSL
ncbi:MAG: HAD-IIB family hydrolase [Cellvibrionaceae bacterium]